MSKAGKAAIAILVVVIIVAVALMLNKKDDTKTSTNTSSNTTTSNTKSDTTSAEVAMTITYDGNGFSESASSIKAGQAVKVVNNSTKSLDFDSDPHPVHTDNTELNAGDIEPGQSKTFVIDKTGTWGYHNHLDASQHGSIMVN